jgi:hypothetical protein
MIKMDYNSQSPSQILLKNITDIALINSKKHNIFECYTTEVIDNIDAITLSQLAYGLHIDINLQDKYHRTPYLKLEFNWGLMIILQADNAN